MTDHSLDATRTRLLDAALAVFSEKGFDKASVRDICKLAQANIAAINYHFGDKAELYRQVFTRAASRLQSFSQAFEHPEPLTALTAYYRVLLAPLSGGDQPTQMARLYSREDFEPTGLLADVKSKQFKPVHDRLVAFVCEQIGVTEADAHIERLAFSIVGMGTFYLQARPVVQALKPQLLADAGAVEDLVAQLARQAVTLLQAHRQQVGAQ